MYRASDYTILIVEDDHDLQDLLTLHLRGQDFTTSAVGTGVEALREVCALQPDLLLLDVLLPGFLDGSHDGSWNMMKVASWPAGARIMGVEGMALGRYG